MIKAAGENALGAYPALVEEDGEGNGWLILGDPAFCIFNLSVVKHLNAIRKLLEVNLRQPAHLFWMNDCNTLGFVQFNMDHRWPRRVDSGKH